MLLSSNIPGGHDCIIEIVFLPCGWGNAVEHLPHGVCISMFAHAADQWDFGVGNILMFAINELIDSPSTVLEGLQCISLAFEIDTMQSIRPSLQRTVEAC